MYRFVILLAVLICSACVDQETALAYARSAHPECSKHRVIGHQLASVSKTNVSMVCRDAQGQDVKRTTAIKCEFGWGILSDTVCHENN